MQLSGNTILSAAAPGTRHTESGNDAFTTLRTKPLEIGMLIFPQMDQIDFTGPFAVFSRIPNSVIHVLPQIIGDPGKPGDWPAMAFEAG